ncbi:MAG: glycosyltransferase [Solobacterium sp.]|nr:glycosyltransferase [Solobacterium sp.]
MAQVTVVVPIYNVEKYVRACFESLLKQTSSDFIVLAVNDGSRTTVPRSSASLPPAIRTKSEASPRKTAVTGPCCSWPSKRWTPHISLSVTRMTHWSRKRLKPC